MTPRRKALALVGTKTEQKGEIKGRRIKFPAPLRYGIREGFGNCVSQEKYKPGGEQFLPEVSITQKVK